ncbi:hypothetical protein ACLX1H_005583 [Fusarium chlamydosporum]
MPGNSFLLSSEQSLKPWQRRALEKGRTPLPEGPRGQSGQAQAVEGQTRTGDCQSSSVVAPTTSGAHQDFNGPLFGYRFWDAAELEHLIRLKREGLSWVEIKTHFPGRSLESLRQTYHKRRGAVEASIHQM